MEKRNIEITLISAGDLKDANPFSKTKAWAVAWINGDATRAKQRTPVDKENGRNPKWNHLMLFTLDEASLQQGRLLLEVEIRTEGSFGGQAIGRVTVPLKEFVKPPAGDGKTTKATGGAVEFVSYQVRKPSGKAQGSLNLSVKLGDKTQVMQPPAPPRQQQQPLYYCHCPPGSYAGTAMGLEPVTAYPAYPPPGSSSSYHPPPPGSQYPPPQSYQGYPTYYQGYPPVVAAQQQQPPRKNNMGLGLGAGLLGGALGGLLIGDMIGDALSFL